MFETYLDPKKIAELVERGEAEQQFAAAAEVKKKEPNQASEPMRAKGPHGAS